MPNLLLTDMCGDPVIVPWDKVMLVEEVRNDVTDDDGTKLRVFEKTKIWVVGGWQNYISVKETVPEIQALIGDVIGAEQLEHQRLQTELTNLQLRQTLDAMRTW